MNEGTKRLVIVGRDVDGWLTALALQHALADNGTRITMLELPSLFVKSDVLSAVPSLSHLNQMLGIDDARLLRACSGVPMVGQRFANWARSASSFMHAYDSDESSETESDFVDYWVKARHLGLRVPFEDFSPGAAAAKQGRVPLAGAFGRGLPNPSFGFQLDARQYAGALKQLALKKGVEHRPTGLRDVRCSPDGIQAVISSDGESFEADIFIDATGAEAALIKLLSGSEVDSWSGWFPADRLLSGSGPPLRPLPAFAQIAAFRGGWLAIHPLQDRTAMVGAFSSNAVDDATLRNLSVVAGIAIEGDLVIAQSQPGVRHRCWIGNCVAVGGSAAEIEPLDSALLHFLHASIGHLVGELTNVYAGQVDRDRYNHTIKLQAESIRDFQLAHFRLNGRLDEPFWDQARNASGPHSLQAKIAAFRSRASLPVAPDEPFRESNWAAVLIGHGIIPDSFSPWAEQIGERPHIAMLEERLRWIAQAVRAMPSVSDFLDLNEAVKS